MDGTQVLLLPLKGRGRLGPAGQGARNKRGSLRPWLSRAPPVGAHWCRRCSRWEPRTPLLSCRAAGLGRPWARLACRRDPGAPSCTPGACGSAAGAPRRPWGRARGGLSSGQHSPGHSPPCRPARRCAPEDVLEAAALAEERVHHRAARRHERCLEQEAEQGQHRVEALRLRVCVRVEDDTLAQLSKQHKVQHDGRRQQRVLGRGGSAGLRPRAPDPAPVPQTPAPSRTSHVLCSTSVLVPPSISSDVYSSSARLLSPT